MRLRDSRVAVIGLGRSGAAACRFCRAQGARVLGLDAKGREQLGEVASELEAVGVDLLVGEASTRALAEVDLVVVSPGVPPGEQIAEVERRGVPVVAEVELASWYVEAPLVAVTGTNGKSTVTSLIGAMLAGSGRPVFAGGNLGTPLVEAVGTEAAGPGGVVVVELSSFQLERVSRLRPHVAVVLDVTGAPDAQPPVTEPKPAPESAGDNGVGARRGLFGR